MDRPKSTMVRPATARRRPGSRPQQQRQQTGSSTSTSTQPRSRLQAATGSSTSTSTQPRPRLQAASSAGRVEQQRKAPPAKVDRMKARNTVPREAEAPVVGRQEKATTIQEVKVQMREQVEDAQSKILTDENGEMTSMKLHKSSVPPQVGSFDLNDHEDLLLPLVNENDPATDEEENRFGKVHYDKQFRGKHTLLNVTKSLTFSSVDLKLLKRLNINNVGQFETQISVENLSAYNVTFWIQTSSSDKFRVEEPIGVLAPYSQKRIVICTNHAKDWRFEDLLDGYFIVHGYPVLFQRLVQNESIQAIWKALNSKILPLKDLESHHISEIRPGNLRMINKTGNYSQFWKIGSTLENIKAKVAKVEAPNFLPPISRAEFNEIWFSRSLKESYLVARFRLRQLKRKFVRAQFKFEQHSKQMENIVACYTICIMSFMFMAYVAIAKFGYFVPEPEVELGWYEKIMKWCSGWIW